MSGDLSKYAGSSKYPNTIFCHEIHKNKNDKGLAP
jgi:hypothetical protein